MIYVVSTFCTLGAARGEMLGALQKTECIKVQVAHVVQGPSIERSSWLGFHLTLEAKPPPGISPPFPWCVAFDLFLLREDLAPLKDWSGDFFFLVTT